MVKDNTPKTSRVTTRAESEKKSETSWEISDDWELIDCILSLSNLADLKLHDIIHNLNQQQAQVEAIEPVVRLDRLHLFLKSVVNLETVNKACKGWDIVFHGTLRKNVTSIIQHGFRLPGKERHTSRFISHWGPGIYCSPYGTYSYNYGHSWDNTGLTMLDPDLTVAIFVCAVVRGTPYQCESPKLKKYTGLEPGFDSYVSDNQREWIVFEEERIIPLCLLWIKRGISPWSWPNHDRVKPGEGEVKNLSGLKGVKGYQYQTLREGMEFKGVPSKVYRKEVLDICRSRREDISSTS